MAQPPRPLTAWRGHCTTLGAGDSRLKRLAPWANASTSSGDGFATVSRPPRATRAGAHTTYLRGQLTMDGERNFANMARNMTGDDGQALQHFMSNSPWSGPGVFQQIQAEITATPALAQGSTLILDESADEKAGTHNAGASRQYNGRMGKVDVCRVDTCLTYANATVGLWAMVDGELFLPARVVWARLCPEAQGVGHSRGAHV